MASGPGHARPAADPADPIRSLIAVLAGRAPSAAAIRSAVERSFDIDAVAREVLAGNVRGATAAQRDRFRVALTDRIVRELRSRLDSDRRWTLDILGTRAIRPNEWLVTSRPTEAKRSPRAIAWRVRSAAGVMRIVDVLGNGTGMVRALHGDYDVALRRYGLDGLIKRMEAQERRSRGRGG